MDPNLWVDPTFLLGASLSGCRSKNKVTLGTAGRVLGAQVPDGMEEQGRIPSSRDPEKCPGWRKEPGSHLPWGCAYPQ